MRREHHALIALLVTGGLVFTSLVWRQPPPFEGLDPHYQEGPVVGERSPPKPKPSEPALHAPITPSALNSAAQSPPVSPSLELLRLAPPTLPPTESPTLPPLPEDGWPIEERGALTAPVELVRVALTQDPTWAEEAGAWRHIAGGATLSLSEQREGRLTGVTLRFEREGGGSAVIPPLEALLLGAGEPSMLRWERRSDEPAIPVGGKLTHRDSSNEGGGEGADQGGERSLYYYCEYPPPQGDEPLLPHTCHFTLEPHPHALKLGESLQPCPSF